MNTFDFQGTTLRTIEIDGEPWFHAADACRCIGVYLHSTTGQPNLTLLKRRMGAEDFMLAPLTVGKGSRPNLISESGLYKLIMRSDKPEARAFQDWVTREVLPSIRKTGGFQPDTNPSFTFEGQQLRGTIIDGKPWFAAPDSCRCAGLPTDKGVHHHLRKLDADEKLLARRSEHPVLFTGSHAPSMTLVSEPGLYKLIQRSNKPAAKRFDRWVRHEVLPAIRKTGGYMTKEDAARRPQGVFEPPRGQSSTAPAAASPSSPTGPLMGFWSRAN